MLFHFHFTLPFFSPQKSSHSARSQSRPPLLPSSLASSNPPSSKSLSLSLFLSVSFLPLLVTLKTRLVQSFENGNGKSVFCQKSYLRLHLNL
ncbi:hypothetical protein ERO13_A10G174200v2 [Gossypium hirsutum]|uniref:Uncharacterized protein n=1 Tax=Gossypium darwinii TaxID=34276 RepID=A0A5D2F0P1_GOSDA|nr:hypothetical protein ERO13_A10G174200v2 [Gossypium hirsutum]KAG4180590.1 hypothetical protein ERO13_A10G174200v2 [Gossypium hirsutum]KAG4180591.1 hypothetical protein ERO13_A10G174200v2 [Gossypium hirsutum]KAG4180592.1 hypothetical protein ERO13_A10G174200v2 [Gossypium hirsutum]TYG99624.1 hypothetical protein ES288_A10G209700v1 [Gossypium darwinii]